DGRHQQCEVRRCTRSVAVYHFGATESCRQKRLTTLACPRTQGRASPLPRESCPPMSARQPIVGIPCDHRMVGAHPFHLVGEKYIAAIRDGAEAVPLLIPVLERPLAIAGVLAAAHGFLFTGSPSNVSPHHYGGEQPREDVLLDETR